ncbi:peptide/nickel transport system permease protein [Rhizomicrobium palustre]|uniref:Peptide/nickel transport system permease protein n=1 Tax=Rhizomicrobium palustre TaxID=189966 RepID=A0A846MWS4_9PROT|nr:ABC transporter permease subunit [Rhizomicrobium palustre]NIK87984.1 peptide/nickel transport system permease protein [Rhizomicrobium palustre]
MKRFLARQAVQLVVGLSGAALAAIALSAIASPHQRNLPGFLAALGTRLVEISHGDFGKSAITGAPVLSDAAAHLPPTLALIGSGAAIALAVGLPLGLLFAFGSIRKVTAPFLQILTATPVFCAGLGLAWAAASFLHWPVSINGFGRGENELLLAVPPIAMVGLAGAAAVQLALRQAAAKSSGEAFRPALKRLGLGAMEIEVLYVLPQILGGLLARAGDIALSLVSAAVVAEWVFHRQGAADLFVKSVALADWTMAAVILFVFAALTILATFAGRIAGYVLAREAVA